MNFTIDTASPVPLYFQVAEAIRTSISSRLLAQGANIGPEHRLAHDFKVSVPTIRKAIDLLQAEGLLLRKRGVGTYVASLMGKMPLSVVLLESFIEAMLTKPELEQVNPEPEVRQELALDGQRLVWRARRRHLVAEWPAAVLDHFFPHRPSAADLSLLTQATAGGRLPSVPFTGTQTVRHQIHTQAADAEFSPLLRVTEGTALTIVRRTDYSWDSSPLAVSVYAVLADRYMIEEVA